MLTSSRVIYPDAKKAVLNKVKTAYNYLKCNYLNKSGRQDAPFRWTRLKFNILLSSADRYSPIYSLAPIDLKELLSKKWIIVYYIV
jgi:hypothetical protein